MVETSAVTLITPHSEETDFQFTPSRKSLVPSWVDPFPHLRGIENRPYRVCWLSKFRRGNMLDGLGCELKFCSQLRTYRGLIYVAFMGDKFWLVLMQAVSIRGS